MVCSPIAHILTAHITAHSIYREFFLQHFFVRFFARFLSFLLNSAVGCFCYRLPTRIFLVLCCLVPFFRMMHIHMETILSIYTRIMIYQCDGTTKALTNSFRSSIVIGAASFCRRMLMDFETYIGLCDGIHFYFLSTIRTLIMYLRK